MSETEAEVLRQTGLPVYWAAGCWRERKVEKEKQTQNIRARGTDRSAHLFTEQQVVGRGETLVVDGEGYDWFSKTLQEQQEGLGH